MILLIWALNFVISWFNAWGCGKTWNETKHNGGFPHFMNWMGATMSACGFSWCYLILGVFVGSVIPVDGEDGKPPAPLFTPEMLQATMDLGYLAIILPIIGSGLAITVHSWGVFYRRRSFGSGAVAGWNTFAQASNMYSAFQHVPDAVEGVGGFFKGKSDSKGKALVLVLVVVVLIGGILTTRAIVQTTAKKTALERGSRYAEPDYST